MHGVVDETQHAYVTNINRLYVRRDQPISNDAGVRTMSRRMTHSQARIS